MPSVGGCSMSDLKTTRSISIVVPFHNEEENVTDLYSRLHAVMEETGWGYQFVFVDDGSTDHTYKLLRELAAIDARVSVVRLRRNFGQTAALAAGFAQAPYRQPVVAEDPIPLRELADGKAQRREHSRLWNDLQSVPARAAFSIAALWGDAPVHTGFGFGLRGIDL